VSVETSGCVRVLRLIKQMCVFHAILRRCVMTDAVTGRRIVRRRAVTRLQ
jgi:hypothetical protein